jgi:hypothetical protein
MQAMTASFPVHILSIAFSLNAILSEVDEKLFFVCTVPITKH